MTAAAQKVLIHPFTDSGLGRAPFRFIGIWSMPSRGLLEQNPQAYNLAMSEKPQVVSDASCSCEHCGQALTHFCIVVNADGQQHVVGTTCVEKTGDTKLVAASTAAKRDRQRKQRRAKQEAKWEANRIATEQRQAEERLANGGATVYEVEWALRINEEWNAKQKFLQDNHEFICYADSLRDNKGGFRDSMHKMIMGGQMPTGNSLAIVVEILAKLHGGRRGSKNYETMCEKLNNLLPE